MKGLERKEIFIFKNICFYFCLWCFLYTHIYVIAYKGQRGIQSPRAKVTGGCKLLNMDTWIMGTDLGSSRRIARGLSAEPSLLPLGKES